MKRLSITLQRKPILNIRYLLFYTQSFGNIPEESYEFLSHFSMTQDIYFENDMTLVTMRQIPQLRRADEWDRYFFFQLKCIQRKLENPYR